MSTTVPRDTITQDDDFGFPVPRAGLYIVRNGEEPVFFPLNPNDPHSEQTLTQQMIVHAAKLQVAGGQPKEWWGFLVTVISHGRPPDMMRSVNAPTDAALPPPGIHLYRDGQDTPMMMGKVGEVGEARIIEALQCAGEMQMVKGNVEWGVIDCQCLRHVDAPAPRPMKIKNVSLVPPVTNG